ncbi:MAG: LUD domain-containing protein [Alphaproteobacteria bacterium]|nr:LUD domain-containing protein [Alphaproteobacteria bacterium]
MSDARAKILSSIRQAQGRQALDAARKLDIETSIASHKPYLIPARAQLDTEAMRTLFIAKAEEVSARVLALGARTEVPAAVRALLAEMALPPILAVTPDPCWDGMDWGDLSIHKGSPRADDMAGLARAKAGIAETGTLMLLSGAASPTLMNFMPDVHLVVLEESRLLGTYEEAWAQLRRESNAMPRAVNLITGPSRTGDIEQTILLGAHGPRRLIILLVKE